MAHKLKSAVFDYFKLSEDGKSFICKCKVKDKSDTEEREECGDKISSFTGGKSHSPTRASNLKRHLNRKHLDIFDEVNKEDEKNIIKKGATNATASTSKQTKQLEVTSFMITQKITITMTKEKFISSIIEMVVKNSVPLRFFSLPAFQEMNGELARKLGVALDRNSIRSLIIKEANHQRQLLKSLINGKFIFLKMDACTRMRTNYFAINIQFMNDNMETIIRTLAVKDTEAKHSSEYIKEIVCKVLDTYNLHKDQILAIVTDNASNMISTIEKLNQDKAEPEEGDAEDDFDFSRASTSGESELAGSEGNPDTSDEFNLSVDMTVIDAKICHMRCAVHTLQLAICDGLKGRHAANLIGMVRNIATRARNPKIDAILKRRAKKGAIIDQVTRWGSTYLMIERILELKSILSDMANHDLTMSNVQWDQVKSLKELLYYPYIVTKKLQCSNLTPGSFIKEWNMLIFRMTQIGGLIAEEIKDSMVRREAFLLDNDILLAAIYVDPLYRVSLNDSQLIKAKIALFNVAVRMNGLDKEIENPVQEDDSMASPTAMSLSSGSSEDEYEIFLDVKERSNKRQKCDIEKTRGLPSKINKFKQDFYAALTEVENFDRTSKLTVINAIPRYPEIVQQAATAVTGLPPTQVSVERLFSALRIIKSHLRGKLKEDLIDAILFLRTNLK